MSTNVVARLVVKDVYLHRWLIVVALVVGVASLLISITSKMAFNVASVFYLTTIIAFGVMLVMYGVVQERKDKCLLFVLSLPLSNEQYLRAKVFAVLATFLAPWGLLTAAGVTLFLATPMPDGFVTFFVLVSSFMLMNFCVILAVALLTTSEVAVTATIILTNLSVSLFFMLIGSLPSITAHVGKDVMVWSRDASIILGAQVAVMLISLTIPFYVRRGRRTLI
jgi:ABC-2 type transport system permease protein